MLVVAGEGVCARECRCQRDKGTIYIDCFPSMGSGQAVPRNDGGDHCDEREASYFSLEDSL